MKFIWFTLLGAIIIFAIIYQMDKVAPKPMPGLTVDGQTVDVGTPVSSTPSESNFEPLDLSSNEKGFLIKTANAAEVKTATVSKTALRTMGNENAPVQMFVFSSLTCSHCAEFHTKALKEVEKEYVDTGKVFFTYVDFPFDSRALAGAMLVRCVPPENYFKFLNVLFENQENWAFKPNAQEIVTTYASLQGLTKGDVKACLSDKVLQQAIIKNRDAFAEKYKISGTPTTVVIKGDKTETIVGDDDVKLKKILKEMTKDVVLEETPTIYPELRAAKPIIYLYPTEETQVLVTVGNPERLTHTYPKYQDFWQVTAYPDGNLKDDKGRSYYALYWEGRRSNAFVAKDGFIVKGSDTIAFLEEKLALLGLTEREANEFIVYWLPELENNEYNFIRFETKEEIDENMPLYITPKPDTTIRVMMEYRSANKTEQVETQQLPPTPERKGFVAVEWGGTRL